MYIQSNGYVTELSQKSPITKGDINISIPRTVHLGFKNFIYYVVVCLVAANSLIYATLVH